MTKFSALNITGVLAVLLAMNPAYAADLMLSPVPIRDVDPALLPAVSGPNGKWEFSIGPSNPGAFSGRAAGSVSFPLGDRFGVQFDGAASVTSGGSWLAGGAVHAFTRDPDSYLLGVAAGVVRGPTGTLGVIGAEGEAYIDNFSLEGWAGFGAINYDVLPDITGLFAIVDAAYYFTDDFRASAGVQHVIGVNGLRLETEYQLRDWSLPASLTGDAVFNTDGSWAVRVGLKGYFGGEEKSLKDRHRQDDPPNRALSLFAASTILLAKTAAACTPSLVPNGGNAYIEDNGCPPADPEAFCMTNGYSGGGVLGTFGSYDGECFGVA